MVLLYSYKVMVINGICNIYWAVVNGKKNGQYPADGSTDRKHCVPLPTLLRVSVAVGLWAYWRVYPLQTMRIFTGRPGICSEGYGFSPRTARIFCIGPLNGFGDQRPLSARWFIITAKPIRWAPQHNRRLMKINRLSDSMRSDIWSIVLQNVIFCALR